ncbi:MAG: DegT/DnrJ/EryC1/StrS family aminotransferase [Candidatus Thorarchaeota archaeon]
MKIMFNNLAKQWDIIKKDVSPKLEALFEKSDFIGGKAIENFENNFANYCDVKYAVGVSNGTDALKLSLAALNLKSPCGVLIPANTFIATVLAVKYLFNVKSDIALIDCDEYYQIDVNLLESYLKENRKKWVSCVIIPVHLYGHPANMKQILELAEQYNCYILEDSSQAHGAMVLNRKVGGIGDISAFSLYPGKNLGAAGDAGIITTNNEDLFNKVKSLRNYGSSKKYYYDAIGWNNRLDTIQAIILNEKLKHLDKWNDARIKVAKKFEDLLKNNKNIVIPKTAPYINKQVYHIYAIRVKNRDNFQSYLLEHGIPTVIHYPIPIQKTKPFKHLDFFNNKKTIKFAEELISLPIYPFLSEEEIEYISSITNKFFE